MSAEKPIITILLVPFGRTRSRRLEIPIAVARWLRDELNIVLGEEPEPATPTHPHRRCRLHRGRWLEGRS